MEKGEVHLGDFVSTYDSAVYGEMIRQTTLEELRKGGLGDLEIAEAMSRTQTRRRVRCVGRPCRPARTRENGARGGHSKGLFETAAFLMGQHMVYSAVMGEPIKPMPGRKRSWAVYEAFRTSADELVFVGITSDKHWQKFCEVFERPDLLAYESLATNNQRYELYERVIADLSAMFRTLTKADCWQSANERKFSLPLSPALKSC